MSTATGDEENVALSPKLCRTVADLALQRLLRPADRALLSDWISQQPDTRIWCQWDGSRSAHDCYIRAATELTKLGLSVSEMTQYALRQVVMELYKDDPSAVKLTGVCQAYAAVHHTGAGPSTRSIVQAVVAGYRQ